MLFWIFLLATIILTVISIVLKMTVYTGVWDELPLPLSVSNVLIGLVTAIMLVIIMVVHIGANAEIESQKQIYESLVYQAENNLYENDNDLGKKEVVNQIQEWNSNLAYNKKIQSDLWVGIFCPNIYDQFDYISLDSIH